MGLFKSTDSGKTWSSSYGAMNGVNAGSARAAFGALAIDPSNPSIILGSEFLPSTPFGIVTYGYVFISHDGGNNFYYDNFASKDAFQSQPEVYFVKIGGVPTVVYTCDQGIFLSADLGGTWTDVSYNIDPPVTSWFYLSNNETAYVNGAAGIEAAAKFGMHITASDVADGVAGAMKKFDVLA